MSGQYSSQVPQPSTFTMRSNIATDGPVTMDQESHFVFFTRALLLLVIFLLRQLPSRYDVAIDSQKFLDSMSMKIGDKEIRGKHWRLAPTGRLNDADLSSGATNPRTVARKHFVEQYYPHAARAIPSAPNVFPVPGAPTLGRPRGVKRPAEHSNMTPSTKRQYHSASGHYHNLTVQ